MTVTMKEDHNMKEVPIWEKTNLTLEEAAAYCGIGINKLREITNEERCNFVLWVGNKRLIKRRRLDAYLDEVYSI
jgi:excisionase family DNA binding protein